MTETSRATAAAARPQTAEPTGSAALLRLFGAMLVTRSALLRADLSDAMGLIRGSLWLGAVCAVAWAMAAIFFSVAILIVFWDNYRIEAAFALPLTFAIAAIIAGMLSRKSLRRAPRSFEHSLQSLRADRDALRAATQTEPPLQAPSPPAATR